MGLISRLLGGPAAATALGQAATGVAEVFVPNATRKMLVAHDAYVAALGEYGSEFRSAGSGWFDRFVNGLNRLPRPMLALGTLGLFAYAMADPEGFGRRMVGLNQVPEPLWWLLAAIVGFYFGAREAHYFRTGGPPRQAGAMPATTEAANPALNEWRHRRAD
ncbi:MAG: holin family protein [Albidovulum sp.]